MPVEVLPGTVAGGLTPVCGSCGVRLCWDISDEEYAEAREFWDAWVCRECNGGRSRSLAAWKAKNRPLFGE